MRDYILTSFIAIIASVFCIHLLRHVAVKVGFVDRPNQRKLHKNEIPLIGGVAIFFGFSFSLLGLHYSLMPYRSLLAGGSILVLMGVVDDFRDLSARLRLFGHVMVALLLAAWGELLINNLGNFLGHGDFILDLWALPFTVFVVVAYLNAFNMIDGQDGLAGCVGLAQTFWLLLFSLQLNLSAVTHMLVILFVLLVVFLSFNLPLPWRRQASIFLGDSGSTLLAFILAFMAILISQANLTVVKPITILWVMSLPLFDLLRVVSLRVWQQKSVFVAGHDHVHHLLQKKGLRKIYGTLFLGGLQFFLGGVGYALNYWQVSQLVCFLIYFSFLGFYFVLVTGLKLPAKREVSMSR